MLVGAVEHLEGGPAALAAEDLAKRVDEDSAALRRCEPALTAAVPAARRAALPGPALPRPCRPGLGRWARPVRSSPSLCAPRPRSALTLCSLPRSVPTLRAPPRPAARREQLIGLTDVTRIHFEKLVNEFEKGLDEALKEYDGEPLLLIGTVRVAERDSQRLTETPLFNSPSARLPDSRWLAGCPAAWLAACPVPRLQGYGRPAVPRAPWLHAHLESAPCTNGAPTHGPALSPRSGHAQRLHHGAFHSLCPCAPCAARMEEASPAAAAAEAAAASEAAAAAAAKGKAAAAPARRVTRSSKRRQASHDDQDSTALEEEAGFWQCR